MAVSISNIRRASEVFAFEWRIPSDGFRWVGPRDSGVDGLDSTSSSDSPGGSRPRWLVPCEGPDPYWSEPLKATALFRRFADLHPASEETVMKFATEYGALRSNYDDGVVPTEFLDAEEEDFEYWVDSDGEVTQVPRTKRSHARELVPAERLDTWQREVRDMKLAIRLWDDLEAGARDRLQGRFRMRMHKDERVLSYSEAEGELVAPVLRQDLRGRIQVLSEIARPGSEVRAGRYLVETAINRRLKEYVTARLFQPRGGFKLYVVPETLLGALWLQFALAVAGHKRYMRCQEQECNDWIEISPEKHHRPKLFCSNKCKQKAFRRRHASGSEGTKQQAARRTARNRIPSAKKKKMKPETAPKAPRQAAKKRARSGGSYRVEPGRGYR